MSTRPTTDASPANFPPTRWSLVLTAGGSGVDSAAALEAICKAYWYPLYAYARRSGQSPHDAQDVTQEFFGLLLQKHWLKDADQRKGRLRAFLVTAFKRFMAKQWRRLSAQRRGGGLTHFALDQELAETRYAADPAEGLPAEELFDRQWALRLLELTIERLERDFELEGKARDFVVFKEFLTLSHERIDYETAAARLGITSAAARVAVHRLRKRFRELYRQEVCQTLPDGESVDDEVRHLARVIAAS